MDNCLYKINQLKREEPNISPGKIKQEKSTKSFRPWPNHKKKHPKTKKWKNKYKRWNKRKKKLRKTKKFRRNKRNENRKKRGYMTRNRNNARLQR